ncbi:MAG: NAD(P)/FAD-dependent oxidoreductase, partial [Bacteroidota bacterium]
MKTSKLYDQIIIGGGPAGSTMATSLATKGQKVLVLEKEKFPRPHVGESLLPFTYQIFEELGVLEDMKKQFSRKPGVTFSNIDGSDASHWCFKQVIKDESALSFHVRRAPFDDLLLQNSRNKGAEVIEEIRVLQVDLSDPHKAVVIGQNHEGKEQVFEAKFVVDASGQSTLLANQMKTKKAFDSLQPRVAYSTHWQNAQLSPDLAAGNIKIVHLEGQKTGWFWMIPLQDRLSIGVALDMEYANQQRRILKDTTDDWQTALYMQELAASPVAQAAIAGATRMRPVAANGDFSYYAKTKWGTNFAIVGDASGFLDPIFSSGIYLGMKSSLLVSEGITELLSGKGTASIEQAYHNISGAYRLVEKLINTFYEPGSIKFDQLG